MKYNSLLEIKNGKEVEVKGETILSVDKKETNIIIDALEDYCLKHPRNKASKALLNTFNNVPLS